MTEVFIREPKIDDEDEFIVAMQRSQSLHHPWVKAPATHKNLMSIFSVTSNLMQSCPKILKILQLISCEKTSKFVITARLRQHLVCISYSEYCQPIFPQMILPQAFPSSFTLKY